MQRKNRRASAIQPPQFAAGLAPDPAPPDALEPGANYAQRIWQGLRFDAAEAEDVSLEGLDVRGGSFQEASLPLVQVADCRFDATDFASCALEKAYLRRVELLGCRLVGVKLNEADLQDVLFARCNARLARFWNMRGAAIRFEQCALQEASFEGANLAGAVFARCDLSGADLRNTNLAGADLRGSTLAGIRVNAKDLKGAIVDAAQAVELIGLFGVKVLPDEAG